MLINLQHLELTCCQVSGHYAPVQGVQLDLGALCLLKRLRCLHIEYRKFTIKHLDRLQSVQELQLTDVGFFLPGPHARQAPICLLPQSVTRLLMLCPIWRERKHETPALWSMFELFKGRLRSLTLEPHFMEQLGSNIADLSALPCLQELQELDLAVCSGLGMHCHQLAFSSLRFLDLHYEGWSADSPPMWDLSSCVALLHLALFWDDAAGESGPIDLRGIRVGSQQLSLHLELCVPSDKRALADFASWSLGAFTVQTMCTEWRQVQSVQDVIDALLVCNVPMSKVRVQNELLEAPDAV